MKKTIIILLLLLTSCYVPLDKDTDNSGKAEETKTGNKAIHEIADGYWNIKPTLEYDDVMIDFRFGRYEVAFPDGNEPYDVHEGYVLVKKDGKYGLLDGEGNVLIDVVYADTKYLWGGAVFFTSGEGLGPCEILRQDETIEYFENGCGIGSDGYFVTFNPTDDSYELLGYGTMEDSEFLRENYGEKYLLVSYSFDGKGVDDFVMIDNGKAVQFGLDPHQIDCFDHSSGVVLFSSPLEFYGSYYAKDPKYYDEKGNLLFEGYDGGLGFYEGYAPVMKDGKWGYINTDGDLVIDYIFDSATQIYDGRSWIIMDGKLGKLNIIDLIEDNY